MGLTRLDELNPSLTALNGAAAAPGAHALRDLDFHLADAKRIADVACPVRTFSARLLIQLLEESHRFRDDHQDAAPRRVPGLRVVWRTASA